MQLSVIIPTHNRAHYAVPTILAILSIPGDIEVVVSDTSEHDNITPRLSVEVLESARLKIVRADRKLNVVENFEAGLQAATGKYICFIGDDDFVDASILKVVEWADASGVDAVNTTMPAHYYWPDFRHKRQGDYYAGGVFVKEFTGRCKKLSTMHELGIAADNLGAGVLGMQRAYAGLISAELAKRIVQKHGALFGGVSPDIYSAALISRESKKCYQIDYPFIIPGSSGESTAGLSANGMHVGKLRENPHIGAFQNLEWNPLIPEFYSIQTVWSFSFVEGLAAIGFDQRGINYPRLYAKCFMYHFNRHPETLSALRAYRQSVGYTKAFFQMAVSFLKEAKWVAAKVFGILRSRVSKREVVALRNLQDAHSARKAVSHLLELRPLVLKDGI